MQGSSKILFSVTLALAALQSILSVQVFAADTSKPHAATNSVSAKGGSTSKTALAIEGSISAENCKKAAAYSDRFGGVSVLVIQDGKVVFEKYSNGGSAKTPQELASGTKSFSGIAAIAAKEDGIIDLDEKISDTISEWKEKSDRKDITVRQLLNLVAGVKTSVLNVPTYADSINCEINAAPGSVFQYGPAPFQIFGEFMKRKLKGKTVEQYLTTRVLDPAGIKIGVWRKGKDGMPLLPQGVQITAQNWSRLGELVLNKGTIGGKKILDAADVEILFKGTSANPMYGLTWWLNRPIDESLKKSIKQLTMATDLQSGVAGVPDDLVLAAGAGKQRLYVSGKLNLIVVRQSSKIMKAMMEHDQTGFSDMAFLQLLTTGKADPKFTQSAEKLHNEAEKSGKSERSKRFMNAFDKDKNGKIDQNERQVVREMLREKFMRRRQQNQ